MGSNQGKRKTVDGDEQDCYTRWRHMLVWTGRAGAVKKVKRRTHKRERQEWKKRVDRDSE